MKTPRYDATKILTPTNATGAVIHHMQKASNAQPESFSVKYATSLATSHQCASKKAKANILPTHFQQGNQKLSNYVWGPFTPTMMLKTVKRDQDQKITSVYK